MHKGLYEIRANTALTADVRRMVLEGDTSSLSAPGQFVEISLDGFFLRRPISVCDYDEGRLVLIYKVVGQGTAAMAALQPGAKLDLLCGLGNGYDLSACGDSPLVVGGGVGVPPLYNLVRRLAGEGRRVSVVLGFNKASEIFYRDEFAALGADVVVATADGSEGVRGFVTDALPESYSHICACGPLPMLRALYRVRRTAGQFSLEERMGCGFGACMGCSIMTKAGAKRVCKDGPVFDTEVLEWRI